MRPWNEVPGVPGAPYSYREEKEIHELIFLRLSCMVSGIARGRVRTTTEELRKMAAILQLTGLETRSLAWFIACFFDLGFLRYSQLTPAKTRYMLTPYHTAISLVQVMSSSRSRVSLR